MTFTYCIGDLHGRADVLDLCLDKIAKARAARGDPDDSSAKIIFLGDYIDRGKQSQQVISRLMAGPSDKSKWVMLMGNHEQMAWAAHENSYHWKFWTSNGGLATAMGYPNQRITAEHLDWMNSLPVKHEDKHRLYVHAGVQKDIPLRLQTDEMLMWVRHGRNEEVFCSKYVVHGHTPFTDGPVILETRCNLDVGSYQTGRACIAVFDDDKAGKPIDILEVIAGYSR